LVTGFSLLLNFILRNKYLAYVVSIGTGAGLFYLYNLGYKRLVVQPNDVPALDLRRFALRSPNDFALPALLARACERFNRAGAPVFRTPITT